MGRRGTKHSAGTDKAAEHEAKRARRRKAGYQAAPKGGGKLHVSNPRAQRVQKHGERLMHTNDWRQDAP